MAIRYNTLLDRPYDDQTGRFISWEHARKSSIFRAGVEEFEDYIRQISRERPPVEAPKALKARRRPLELAPGFVESLEEEEEVYGYDLIQDIMDIYLEEYEIDPEDINDSP